MYGYMLFLSFALLNLYVGHYHTFWHIIGLCFLVIMAFFFLAGEQEKKAAAYVDLRGDEQERMRAEVYKNRGRDDLILKIFHIIFLFLLAYFFMLKKVCTVENLFDC